MESGGDCNVRQVSGAAAQSMLQTLGTGGSEIRLNPCRVAQDYCAPRLPAGEWTGQVVATSMGFLFIVVQPIHGVE